MTHVMKIFGIIFLTLGSILIVLWGSLQFFGDEIVTEFKKTTESAIIEIPSPENAAETIQIRQYTIKVSNEGTKKQMDYCAGGFTKMTEYEDLGNTALLSAHNNCGGDIILPIEMGDQVIIEGQGTYVVTELRDTTKKAQTSDIIDMNGEVLLQTCYYESSKMKFVALTPIK